jgi:hypothetical protein
VTVTKDGYDVTSGTVQVAVYDAASNPEKMLATGGAIAVTKVNGVYYETHKFIKSDDFVFNGTTSLSARVLVVGGGGGAGGGDFTSSGAGSGGMVENNAYTLSKGTYKVTIGVGGTGGATGKDGKNGDPSSFGSGITANGGNLSKGRSGAAQPVAVGTGGASGSGSGGTVYSNLGGTTTTVNNYAAGGGGAGKAGSAGTVHIVGTANYAGEGRANDITGESVIYAMGGPIAPYTTAEDYNKPGIDGTANTGDGGGGAWNGKGGNGGSGVVIVRFPVPSAQ